MPILDVELIGDVPEEVRRGLAARIADSAAQVFESAPQSTWVKVRFIPGDAYAENAGGPPPGAQPVLVSVIQADPPEGGDRAAQMDMLTRAIATACRRPAENVHLMYEPPARGRIAFGGKLRS